MTKSKKKQQHSCIPAWMPWTQYGLAVVVLMSGFALAVIPGPWSLIPTLIAPAAFVAMEAIRQKHVDKSHRCGLHTGIDMILHQISAAGIQVVRMDSEGVERL